MENALYRYQVRYRGTKAECLYGLVRNPVVDIGSLYLILMDICRILTRIRHTHIRFYYGSTHDTVVVSSEPPSSKK